MLKKTNRLVGNFEYICRHDSAVDDTVEDFEHKWQLYLDGQGPPPLKSGEQPTTLLLKHLSSVELERVFEYATQGGAACAMAACAVGLVGAKNLDGKDRTFERERDDQGFYKIEVVKKDELDAFDIAALVDIGGRIVMAATPRPN